MVDYRCKDGDVLDLICYRFYGDAPVKAGVVEYVLNYNQNIARSYPHLIFPAGTMLSLPALPDELKYPPAGKIKIFVNS
jgi:phage tail protein X